MRPSVHSSVSNPNAAGPLPSASATASSSAADSRGRRPARPAPRSAASPPWCHRRYQVLAAWAETPKVRATSAWLAPWANMRAASKRRSSRPAKSRRQLPTLIGLAGTWRVVVLMPSSVPAPFAAIKLLSEPLFSEVGGELVDEVLPATCLPRPKLGDLADGAAHPVRVAATVVLLGPADLAVLAALQPQQAPSLPRGERRRHKARFPLVGHERRACHPVVHPTARQA